MVAITQQVMKGADACLEEDIEAVKETCIVLLGTLVERIVFPLVP